MSEVDVIWSIPGHFSPCGFVLVGDRDDLHLYVREIFGDGGVAGGVESRGDVGREERMLGLGEIGFGR